MRMRKGETQSRPDRFGLSCTALQQAEPVRVLVALIVAKGLRIAPAAHDDIRGVVRWLDVPGLAGTRSLCCSTSFMRTARKPRTERCRRRNSTASRATNP